MPEESDDLSSLSSAERSLFRASALGSEALQILSPRQRQVFDRIVAGRSSAEAAVDLHVAEKTIDTHRNQINRKLGTGSPADLVRFAAVCGVLDDILSGECKRIASSMPSQPPTFMASAVRNSDLGGS